MNIQQIFKQNLLAKTSCRKIFLPLRLFQRDFWQKNYQISQHLAIK